MIENDPVSYLLQRIVLDPATTKLLTAIFSLILFISTAGNARHLCNLVPLLIVFGASLIYSVISVLVVVFKKREKISDCAILKKIFRGRKVYWHEIQTSAALALAFANISGVLALDVNHATGVQVVFSALNIILFLTEWYFAAKNGKHFVLEENSKLGHTCMECILGAFHSIPLFFNVIRKACFIAALILVTTNSNFGHTVTYYIYCTGFAIFGSFLLFTLQTSGTLENSVSSKLVSGKKWHTYLMLIITVHAFLAVLTLPLVFGRNEIRTPMPHYDSYNNYNNNGYYNRNYYNNYYRNNGAYDYYLSHRTTTISPDATPWYFRYNNRNGYFKGTTNRNYDRSATPGARQTTWYTQYYYRSEYFNGITEAPVAFTLSCIALVLSLLDLYSRAIYSRSRRDNDVTSPLHITGGINKIEDLPIAFASPHNYDTANKNIHI